jgi:NitT/TauT family transport system permease protein
MALAYVISLAFSLVYARIAAASRMAERFMIPLLDVLQSIPILSFMPGVVLGFAALFPGRNVGLELASILLIFTSQAWNLAFSFHQSLVTTPRELKEAATVYRLGVWRRFTRLELPAGAISLIANSMMSWAGGWFFLMASEQFRLGTKNFRLPGLGSYLAAAADAGDVRALVFGLTALITVIVLLDQLLWRPLVAWSDRFKVEQSASSDFPRSPVLDAMRSSAFVYWVKVRIMQPAARVADRAFSPSPIPIGAVMLPRDSEAGHALLVRVVRGLMSVAGVAAALSGIYAIGRVVTGLSPTQWRLVTVSASATFLRTAVALVLGVAWTVPVGVWIGFNPRRARRLQPLIQIAGSVPATALFPLLLLALISLPGGLNLAAVTLMLLGTQWYILFNVVAGAMAIPADLKEAATVYHVDGWRKWRTLILPAVFPYLITGMITATGGAWNASIVSEYVTFAGKTMSTVGLGAVIAHAADRSDLSLLLAGTLTMSAIVVCANRLVWRRLYLLAESRYRVE